MNKVKRTLLVFVLATISAISAVAQVITGKVVDQNDKQPLIGAAVQVEGVANNAVTDIDGNFRIEGLKAGIYTLVVKYVGYKTLTLKGVKAAAANEVKPVSIELKADEKTLGEVQVTGVAKRNTATSMIQMAHNSALIESNVSAQEISRTQDSNAGEVIRRIPGVSIIEGKFVMVRGLSQRYNNVWVNGGAVPSSEADSRAFSFDVIPSSQIDNMQIIKTPSPEYPADYSGGFILINTKDIPSQNSTEISVGGNWNDNTVFTNMQFGKGSATDFLGFDNGLRSMKGGIDAKLVGYSSIANSVDLTRNGLNNNWHLNKVSPVGDLKLSANMSRKWRYENNSQLGMIAAVNYSNAYERYDDMPNNLFGVYDAINDKSNYLHEYTDQQFNHNVRLGAMLNFTYLSATGNNRYQFKNIFNQIGQDRYTMRQGYDTQSNQERSSEYYYRSRTTYNGQITGRHTLASDVIDWSASYSFANRNVPDRRRIVLNDQAGKPGEIQISRMNDLSREWTYLYEHIASVAVNETHEFAFGDWTPTLKAGVYGEYRYRDYKAKIFYYQYDESKNSLPNNFRLMNAVDLLSNSDYFGEDKLYLFGKPNMSNWYSANNTLGAGYVAATLPLGKLSIYAGVRFEHDKMVLTTNQSNTVKSPLDHVYTYNDLFPSLNSTFKFNEKHQVRLSYGKTVNRPEFREISPSVFYDFDLSADVQGYFDLKPCYIQNVDLRYEFYPSKGETLSLAAFYKYFDSPIEWTYTSNGTNLVYSYTNANHANNYGLELDIKKDLAFIGLRNFMFSFNGALIKSKVKFKAGTKDENRPMQGQSPYLINTGIFYKNDRAQLDVAVLYNRIGKRIIGVGRSDGSSGNEKLRVPDSYEMPRDAIDLSVSKKFGTHWELKFNVRDLLAQKVYYKQFADVTYPDGHYRQVEQITRSYKPGRNFGLNAVYKF